MSDPEGMTKEQEKALTRALHILQEHFDTSMVVARDFNKMWEWDCSGDYVIVDHMIAELYGFRHQEELDIEEKESWEEAADDGEEAEGSTS